MSLITVINQVCDAVDIDRFDSVYGTNDPTALTMMQLAQEAGDEIARRVDWRGLIATSAITASGASLPDDFQRLIPGGSVRSADGLYVRPITNSSQWAFLSQYPSASQAFYFLVGDTIAFSPVSAGDNAVIDYVSTKWLQGTTETKSSYSSDDDEALFPEKLMVKNIVWRWRREKGLAYNDHLSEFEADLVEEINANRGVS